MGKQKMHEANCWECKWGEKGTPDNDGVIPLTCKNDSAVIMEITETVWLCNAFKLECEEK